MIIKELELNNFICYLSDTKEPIKIKFENGVNIFRGSNGGGKSQLFNAFYWVLFEWVYITGKGWQKGFPTSFIPDSLKHSTKEGNTIDISVILKIEAFSHQKKDLLQEYIFCRTIQFVKSEKDFQISKNQELEISYIDEGRQTNYIPNLENEKVISIILPERLRKYMWFQGETIDELIDFNSPHTLKQAVETLSYYPIYRQLNKISKLVFETVQEKINEAFRQNSRLSSKEDEVLREIETTQRNITNCIEKRVEIKKNIDAHKEKLNEIQNKLSAFSEFPKIEQKIKEIDIIDNEIKAQINDIERESKTEVINLWMLNGTAELIKDSKKILKTLSKKIKENSITKNPIPLKVPGNTYINQMLEDEMCYICERKAIKGSKEYESISNRLSENKKVEEEYKEAYKKHLFLENSYVELANKPDEILSQVLEIPLQIKKYRSQLVSLFQKRRVNIQNRTKVYEDLKINEDDIGKIRDGSSTAKELTNSLIFYKDKITELQNKLIFFKESEEAHSSKLIELRIKREGFKKKGEKKSEFEFAEPYAELLYKITNDLKENAYERLISEIEKEANQLYQDYLSSNTSSKGAIRIDRQTSSVGIEDNGSPIVLSQGLTTAAKMSVINAILSLSSRKIGKSYPLIADAPSSVFSSENTQAYTKKIGDTFKQVIIMSKDYSDDDLKKLKAEKHISKIWLLENKKIDPNSSDNSRANYKTYIKEFK